MESLNLTPALDIAMRGGDNPNSELDEVERQIAAGALQRLASNPVFADRGLKWTYNWTHFNTWWMTKNPKLVDLLFKHEPYPQYIEVETTTTCNLRCRICEHTYWDEPARNMTFDQFRYVVDQFPDLKWIGMTGIGESFCNPDFLRMVEYVKSRGVYVELYDSFYYIDDDGARRLVELGVEKIFASIDGATKLTYEAIRRGSDFDRVWDNVKRLDKWKKRLNRYFPELCFHYIVTRDNIGEVVEYLELLRRLKLDVHFVQYTRMLHDFPEISEMFVEIPEETQETITQRANELGINIGWNATVPAVKPPVAECTAWWMPFIFVDGTVIPCCCLNEGNHREWQRETSLGNIFETPFREIWDGDEYRNMRRTLWRGEVPRNCARCSIYEVG